MFLTCIKPVIFDGTMWSFVNWQNNFGNTLTIRFYSLTLANALGMNVHWPEMTCLVNLVLLCPQQINL